MKMLISNDVCLGAVSMENLDINLSRQWQSMRMKKLPAFVDKASQENAKYVLLTGNIFGQKRVSESVISDSLFKAAQDDPNIQILLLLDQIEFSRINYRNDIPENLHLICMETLSSFEADNLSVRVEYGAAKLQLGNLETITIARNADDDFTLSSKTLGEKTLLSFEPMGFEDDQNKKFGYSLLEWTEDSIDGYEEKKEQTFSYKTVDLPLTTEDGQKEITSKISKILTNLKKDTFLRLDVKGKSPFPIVLKADSLKGQLQNKIFYAEVYINTVMDIDEAAFENDISLRGEFVRLALQDDSLSETEKSQLIQVGWNVLTNKEVSR